VDRRGYPKFAQANTPVIGGLAAPVVAEQGYADAARPVPERRGFPGGRRGRRIDLVELLGLDNP
jgi:hypothetical protein